MTYITYLNNKIKVKSGKLKLRMSLFVRYFDFLKIYIII